MFGNLFARSTIIVRICLLIGVAALGIVGVLAMGIYQIETSLAHERQEQTRRIVGVAQSIIMGYVERAKAGEFSEEEARKRALRTVSNIRYDSTNYVCITDWNGKMLAHPAKELLNTNVLEQKDAHGNKMFADTIEMAKKGGGVLYYYWKDTDGVVKPKLSYVMGVPEWKWALASGVFVDDAAVEVWEIKKNLGIASGILLIVTLGIASLIGRSISKPVKVASASFTDGVEEIAATSCQLSTASQHLAEGASEQAAAIEETASSLEEMSSMTKQNADYANQANTLMSGTRETVAQASETMGKLTTSMREISQASEATSKIIKTIDEIAFQTNLLALNAAVEAARAGEAGAGFAVVANEVRNLAMRAAEAAKNTASLIEGTVKKVKEGSELVEKTDAEFRDLALSIAKSGELVGEISAASQEQAQGIEQINKAVSEMDQVVQQNAVSAEQSASASGHLSVQAKRMKEFAGALRALVDGSKGNGAAGNTASKYNRTFENKTPQNPPGIFGGHHNKGNGHAAKSNGKALNQFKKVETKAAQVIPFDDGEISNF